MSNNNHEDRILQLIRESDSPVPIKRLCDQVLGSAGKREVGLCEKALVDLKDSRQIFEYPPERAGSGVRFGSVSPTDFLSKKLVTMIDDAGGRLTIRKLRDGMRKREKAFLDETMGKLLKEGRLFYLTVRFKYLLSLPPTPTDHLLPRQITALREILERVNRHREKSLTIGEMRTFLDTGYAAGIATNEDFGKPSEELLHEWYQKDLPRRGGLSSIPIPWTWAHYNDWCSSNNLKPNLEQFHDLLLNLQRMRKIEFIPHSMTHSLPERDYELSLKSQQGEVLYYWKWR